MRYVLAVDQGTTSSRAILFDEALKPVATGQQEFQQHFPKAGWVEHDPEDIWSSTAAVCRVALEKAHADPEQVAAIGVTNQRETVVVWDKASGRALYNAIVWQDRRTADLCSRLKSDGLEPLITQKTGLLLDPYFSATKLAYILDNVDGARAAAEKGDVLFGTIDTYLIWRMTGGSSHVTDATNAARTLLFNISTGDWDDELLKIFNIPRAMLPEVRDCADEFGVARRDLFGADIPILGVAGDQQAATIGQACFEPGMVKSTYGTGCFALLNTGDQLVPSTNRLLTTVAYRLDGKTTYALEGSIFVAGAVVQWLRDGLNIIQSASETQGLAETADDGQDLILVPAFTGLGAPYWNANCRGAVFGLTRNSGPAEFARAALQSIGFQTRDLTSAMQADWANVGDKASDAVLRVDGGMSASDYTMQFLSDMIGVPVDRPPFLETTALGAAWLAGMKAGLYPDQSEFARTWSSERRFQPAMDKSVADTKYAAWSRAIASVQSMHAD